MIDSLKIENFRGFASASLDRCRPVNIIVGDNGTGKTALLEGLFLAAGRSPELAARVRGFRGLEGAYQGTYRQIAETIWGDIFHNFDISKVASVTLVGSYHHTRAVHMHFRPAAKVVPLLPSSDLPTEDAGAFGRRIVFDYQIPGWSDVISVEPQLREGKILVPPVLPLESGPEAYFFAANRTYPTHEAATRFSALSRYSRKEEILNAFQKIFPNITDLSIEVQAGCPAVFAEIKTSKEKIPLALASGAMNKILHVLLAIPQQRGALYLIDEVENGIFHTRLPAVWEALVDFVDTYDGQLFASTHSAECIRAAGTVAAKRPDLFSVVHAGPDGLRQFDGDKFVWAVEENTEIR